MSDRATMPTSLTHYYRPFSRPLLSISSLTDRDYAATIETISNHEPLPRRLTEPSYRPERLRIEERMGAQFALQGGEPQIEHPHYFVLGTFSLWEADGSLKVEVPLDGVSSGTISFTLTDSFFNYRRKNFHGVAIPERAYHDKLYTFDELPAQLKTFDLPTEAWRSDPARRFEVYVEAQVWSDEPVKHLLA